MNCKYGIATTSIIPIRLEPSEKSEMLSQLLFGEMVTINEEYLGWLKIETLFDSYTGWIDNKMISKIGDADFEILNSKNAIVNTKSIQLFDNTEFIHPIIIVPGSSLYLNPDNQSINLINKIFYYKDSVSLESKNLIDKLNQKIANTSLLFLHAPYLWGGRTPYGIDCSGFSQIVYKINGKSLPRDANQQVNLGKVVEFIKDAQPGDLAFFDNENGEIVHVGIVLENNKIIHASGSVRIDHFDHQGIYNDDLKKYTHKLRVIKKMID